MGKARPKNLEVVDAAAASGMPDGMRVVTSQFDWAGQGRAYR